MKNKIFLRNLILIVAFVIGSSQIHGQDKRQEFHNQIYTAFVSGNMKNWEQTLNEMETYYNSFPLPDMLYDLLLARYGFI
ncbi:MAG: hypothetical protein ABR597_00610, partial [Bacteroidales bacterium]